MPRVSFAILLVLLALTQTTVLPMIRVIGITPNLVLVALLLWSTLREPREGLLWAFGAGVFLDLLTLTPLGSTALTLLPVAMIGWLGRNRVFQSGLLFPLLMTMLATVANTLATLALGPLLGTHLGLVAGMRLAALGALLNAIAAPPLYLIVQLLNRWIERNDSYVRA